MSYEVKYSVIDGAGAVVATYPSLISAQIAADQLNNGVYYDRYYDSYSSVDIAIDPPLGYPATYSVVYA